MSNQTLNGYVIAIRNRIMLSQILTFIAEKIVRGPQQIYRTEFIVRSVGSILTIALCAEVIKYLLPTVLNNDLNNNYVSLIYSFGVIPLFWLILALSYMSFIGAILARLANLNRSGWWFLLIVGALDIYYPVGIAMIVILAIWPQNKKKSLRQECNKVQKAR